MATFTPEELALIAGMKRAGLTTKNIAARFGCTPSQITVACKALKAKRHLTGRSGRALTRPPHVITLKVSNDDIQDLLEKC
jgi:transposase-like protein